MTGSNWGRTTDPDSDMTSLAYTLQDILQKQEVLEAYIMRKHEDSGPSAAHLVVEEDVHEDFKALERSSSMAVQQMVF